MAMHKPEEESEHRFNHSVRSLLHTPSRHAPQNGCDSGAVRESACSASGCRASSGELKTEAQKAAATSDYVGYGMETERRDEGMLGQLHNLQK